MYLFACIRHAFGEPPGGPFGFDTLRAFGRYNFASGGLNPFAKGFKNPKTFH